MTDAWKIDLLFGTAVRQAVQTAGGAGQGQSPDKVWLLHVRRSRCGARLSRLIPREIPLEFAFFSPSTFCHTSTLPATSSHNFACPWSAWSTSTCLSLIASSISSPNGAEWIAERDAFAKPITSNFFRLRTPERPNPRLTHTRLPVSLRNAFVRRHSPLALCL